MQNSNKKSIGSNQFKDNKQQKEEQDWIMKIHNNINQTAVELVEVTKCFPNGGGSNHYIREQSYKSGAKIFVLPGFSHT